MITLAPDGTSQATIVAPRGFGKTTLARKLLSMWPMEYQGVRRRVYLYDPLDEYGDMVDETCYDAGSVVDAFENKVERVRYCRGTVEDAAVLLEYLMELDNLLVLQDEADAILDPCRKCNPRALLWINDYGRHVGQGMICMARRVSALPRDFTAQSILFFKPTVEPADIEYIRKRTRGADLPELSSPWDWYGQDLAGNITVIPGAWILGNN